MTQDEREKYRRRLVELADRLRKDDAAVADEALRQAGGEASGNISNVPMHLADQGTDNFEQQMSATLLTNERQMQKEVATALDRLEQGTFGKCQNCGTQIGKGRLEAVPYTRYCVDCAQTAEEDGEDGFRPTLL